MASQRTRHTSVGPSVDSRRPVLTGAPQDHPALSPASHAHTHWEREHKHSTVERSTRRPAVEDGAGDSSRPAALAAPAAPSYPADIGQLCPGPTAVPLHASHRSHHCSSPSHHLRSTFAPAPCVGISGLLLPSVLNSASLLVLRDQHHHVDADQEGDQLLHRLPDRGLLQQLGDHGHGGDVDEAAGSERQNARCGRRV